MKKGALILLALAAVCVGIGVALWKRSQKEEISDKMKDVRAARELKKIQEQQEESNQQEDGSI